VRRNSGQRHPEGCPLASVMVYRFRQTMDV
jgi:hypothetical protein